MSDLNRTYTDEDGVIRWKSNDSVPPADLDLWDEVDFETRAFCDEVRDREMNEFLDAYREKMKDHVPSDEERFEMRAAFGEGTEVVNIITGRRMTV